MVMTELPHSGYLNQNGCSSRFNRNSYEPDMRGGYLGRYLKLERCSMDGFICVRQSICWSSPGP